MWEKQKEHSPKSFPGGTNKNQAAKPQAFQKQQPKVLCKKKCS